MTTVIPEPPDDEEGERLAKLFGDPIVEIWHGIETGVTAAVEFFLPDYRTPDPHMAAQIVRYETVLALSRAQAKAQQEEFPLDWEFKAHHNSGIEIVIGDWHMKAFKARDDGPPAPGHSFSRRAFWQQSYSPMLWNVGSEGGNVILYWRVGSSEAIEMCLCKPRGTWDYKGAANVAWTQPISYDPTSGLQFIPGQHDDEELGIFRTDSDTDTGEQDEVGDG